MKEIYRIKNERGQTLFAHWSLWECLDFLFAIATKYEGKTFKLI